jgi:hypothetical protein
MKTLCEFDFTPADAGRHLAVCRSCGRRLTSATRNVTAACRAGPRYHAVHAAILAGRDPRAVGLGEWISRGLAAVGITPSRVSRWLGRPCKCKARAAALDRAGFQVAESFRKVAGAAVTIVSGMARGYRKNG